MGLKKKVSQLKDGRVIATYDSTNDAAAAVGVDPGTVSKACLGKVKLVKGFSFEYTGEYTNKQERVGGDYKCPYCDLTFKNYNGLAKHVLKYKAHGDEITAEQLLADTMYDGVRPKCKCGCGGDAPMVREGGLHFGDFIRGHQSRVHNNWGHNEKAKQNSAETRRQQYKSGERIQWNKGKTWEETYIPEKIEELRKVYSDDDRNEKIRCALKGVHKSPEHAERCRENGRCQRSIEVNRKRMHDMLVSGKFCISSEAENEFIETCIDPIGVEYEKQHYISDIHHYSDVYIPSKNTIIEFQGDFWHANPERYNQKKLYEFQTKRIKKDEELREYCKANGINLIEVWESDFYKNADRIRSMLEESLT